MLINNADQLALVFDAYNPDDTAYIASLKHGDLPALAQTFWNTQTDVYDPFSTWDRTRGCQLRIKGPDGTELVSPSRAELFGVDDNLIVVVENNRYRIRAFRNPTIAVTTPTANAVLTQARTGGAELVVVDWTMRDAGLMGWTPTWVARSAGGLVVKQAGRADVTLAATLDAAQSTMSLTRWTLSVVFQHPGATTLVGTVRGASLDTSPNLNVTVAGSGARDLAAQFTTAIAGSVPPAIAFGPAGGTIPVRLTASAGAVWRNVRFMSTLGNQWAAATPAPSGPPGSPLAWDLRIAVGLDAHPASHTLTVEDTDVFGIVSSRGFAFAVEDNAGPVIEVSAPAKDEPFATRTLPLSVTVSGRVSDSQTGYRAGTLAYSFGTQHDVPVAVDANGGFSFAVSVQQYGPTAVTLAARDNAARGTPPGNVTAFTQEFKVVEALAAADLDDMLSTRAYLDELLRFVRTHLADGNASIDSSRLTLAFGQPFGALAQPGHPDAERLASDLLLPVRLFRDSMRGRVDPNWAAETVDDHLHLAYEALLRGIGTSFEELRSLALMSVTDRRLLALRLGLQRAQADVLQILVLPAYPRPIRPAGPLTRVPAQVTVRAYRRGASLVRSTIRSAPNRTRTDNFGPSRNAGELLRPLARDTDGDGIPNYADRDDDNDTIPDDVDLDPQVPNRPAAVSDTSVLELWLARTFGLPLTYTPADPALVPRATPVLVQQQCQTLALAWDEADAQASAGPDLDPDLVDADDLAADATAWRALLQQRAGALDAKFVQLRDTAPPLAAIALVLDAAAVAAIQAVAVADAAGEPIADRLQALSLDAAMLRPLVGYLSLATADTVFSVYEREDMAHLLLEIWKRRTQHAEWRRVERDTLRTRPWPTVGDAGAWSPGANFRRDFWPWRGTVARRSALEKRLNGRHADWNAVDTNLQRGVLDVQRATLPMLRDQLLKMPRPLFEDVEQLNESWLMDVASQGVLPITPVEQAVSSLQTLVNGVRNKWFESWHPAANWKVRQALASFDLEWRWLDSQDRWRAGVLNFLYPENVLYPELRGANTARLNAILDSLRAIQPPSTDALERLDISGISGDELAYFLPVAKALALQRAGSFAAALDKYREVYDVTLPLATDPDPLRSRKQVDLLKRERDDVAPAPDFDADDFWPLKLSDPHAVAMSTVNGRRVFGNPYTRFTLLQIVQCLLGSADNEFAAGTLDSRTKARGLYLAAREALSLPELIDRSPANPQQVFAPNRAFAAQREHVAAALAKLRFGLSYLGTPLPPDITRGAGAVLSTLVRPTPYRFKVLLERSRQLVSLAQQFEAQYLAAIEKQEAELEKLLREGFAADIAAQTVTLRSAGVVEAQDGVAIAQLQAQRSQIERDQFQDWLSAGPNQYERAQLDAIAEASTFRQVANAASTIASAATSSAAAANIINDATSFGAVAGFNVAAAVATAAAGVASGLAIYQERQTTLQGIYASQQRRADEWRLQANLASQDVLVGAQQVALSAARVGIATQELAIAQTQQDQSAQMLAFLRGKTTSAAFYGWLTGALNDVYGFFLRLATATARQAELQLAFERQEASRGIIRVDYLTTTTTTDDAPDRRGITGSARLTQDLYTLDQYAFSSERRLLNLSQSFSLAQTMPVEFESFRRTGQLSFATPMAWFDDGFPGHYIRLVKRARLTVAALLPPTQGIRATLSNGGLSRVVTADPGYPTLIVRQDPQLAAYTAPVGSTGVFEIDAQPDLLSPFEGTGVDTAWSLELPRAGNPFDFDSLMDVVLTLDYTAQFSADLRERVVKTLPRQTSGNRVFSVRLDLPDTWYDLANGSTAALRILVSRRTFPTALAEVGLVSAALSIRDTDGVPCRFRATLAVGDGAAVGPVQGVAGIASSRQSGGGTWQALVEAQSAVAERAVAWTLTLADEPGQASLLEQLRAGEVDDILVVLGYEGLRPAW